MLTSVQYWKRLMLKDDDLKVISYDKLNFTVWYYVTSFLSDSNGPVTYALHSSHSQHRVSSSPWICGAMCRKHRHQVSEVAVQRPLYSM